MKPSHVVRNTAKQPVLVEFELGDLVIGFHQAGKESYRIGCTDTYVPVPLWRDMVRTTYAIFKEPARTKQLEFQLTKGGSL